MGKAQPKKMSEVEETLKRISSHKGVIGTVIINNEGVPIRSNLERSEQTAQYASQITDLTRKARSVVRDLDPQVLSPTPSGSLAWSCQRHFAHQLAHLWLSTERFDLLADPIEEARDYGGTRLSSPPLNALQIARYSLWAHCCADKEYLLVVIQNPNAD